MNTVENTVGGKMRDGRIVLDRPMNWPEGTRVMVQLVPEGPLVEGVWPADGSPEGNTEILRRMEEGADDVPTEEEAAAFEAALKEVRQANPEIVNNKKARQP